MTSRRGFVLGGAVGAAALVGWSARGPIPATAKGKQPFTMVRKGRALSSVWWSGGPAAEHAAKELSAYVAVMTGAVLPVHASRRALGDHGDENTRDVVVVVPGRAHQPSPAIVSSALAPLQDAPSDSFLIDSTPARVLISGVGPRAVLYSTYALLEQLGVRFFAPAYAFYQGTNEFVPSRSDVVVEAVSATQRPRLELRRIYAEEAYTHTAQTIPALLDWMAKSRLNTYVYPTDYVGIGVTKYDNVREIITREAGLRGIQIEVGGHGYESFLPPEEYPQYYTGGTNVFDIFDEEALSAYLDKVMTFLRERPEIDIFDCWPPDGANYAGELTTHFGKGANAESVVVNALAARLRAELPGTQVERIAYHQTVEPPDAAYQCDPDVLVDYAPFSRNYSSFLGDSANGGNVNQSSPLVRWRDSFDGRISMYEYYRRYRWRSLPVQVRDVAVQDVEWESALGGGQGVQGMGMYSEPADWMPYEFMMSLVAALSWDGSLDAATFTAGYLESRVGAAAAPSFQEYLDHTQGDADYFGSVSGGQDATRRYTAAREALTNAIAATENPSGRLLLERLLDNVTIALADMQISVLQGGDTETLSTALVNYRALVEDNMFKGIILPNMQVRWRWGEGGPYANAAVRQDVFDTYSSPARGRLTPRTAIGPDRSAELTITIQDIDFAGHDIRWEANVPAGMTLSPSSGVVTVGAGLTVAVPAQLTLGDAPSGTSTITVTFTTDGVDLPSGECIVTVRRPVPEVALNCGSAAAFTGVDGTVWDADKYHNGGVAAKWDQAISGTEDDDLFRQFRRSGSSNQPLTYDLPLTSGAYDVTVNFMEPYYGGAGRRVFDVVANGTVVIEDMDIFATAGSQFAAVTRTFAADAVEDLLSLSFPASQDLGLVCSIRAVPQP